MASNSKRSKFFDNAKFFLIFLVVFGHLISPLKEENGVLFTLYTVIYLFHMPAFIFISGYFAKGFKQKGYLKRSVKKILIPYFIFQFIYSVFYFLNGQEDRVVFDFLNPHWSLWFLMSLFFWNLLLYLFAGFKWYGLIVAFLIGIGIGYVDYIGSFLSLSRTFVFFPYFLLGYLLKGDQLKRVIKWKYSWSTAILIILVTLFWFKFEFPKDAVPWLLGDSSYTKMGAHHFIAGAYRGFQYGLTLIVILCFLALIPSNQFKLTKIGERTLYVYLLHGFIIKTFIAFLPEEKLLIISNNYLLLIILTFIICLILGSYLTKKYTRPIIELRL